MSQTESAPHQYENHAKKKQRAAICELICAKNLALPKFFLDPNFVFSGCANERNGAQSIFLPSLDDSVYRIPSFACIPTFLA